MKKLVHRSFYTPTMDALRQLNAVNSKIAITKQDFLPVNASTMLKFAAYAVIQKSLSLLEALDVSKDNIQNASFI